MIVGSKSFIQRLESKHSLNVSLCVGLCTHASLDALSIRVLVDKWAIGFDFNLENAGPLCSPYETLKYLRGISRTPVMGIKCNLSHTHLHSG